MPLHIGPPGLTDFYHIRNKTAKPFPAISQGQAFLGIQPS